MSGLVVYASDVDDNRRWLEFASCDGDVVISTRSKHGTTWTQMICLLLVLGTEALPEPLGTISPWVDWVPEPLPDLVARLEAQSHRRVLKTHTPLDGVVIDPRATYLVVARNPLDGAVSLYHQSDNMDRARVAELLGQPPPAPRSTPRPLPTEWLREWAVDDSSPAQWLESPRGVLRTHIPGSRPDHARRAGRVRVPLPRTRAVGRRGLAAPLTASPGPRDGAGRSRPSRDPVRVPMAPLVGGVSGRDSQRSSSAVPVWSVLNRRPLGLVQRYSPGVSATYVHALRVLVRWCIRHNGARSSESVRPHSV